MHFPATFQGFIAALKDYLRPINPKAVALPKGETYYLTAALKEMRKAKHELLQMVPTRHQQQQRVTPASTPTTPTKVDDQAVAQKKYNLQDKTLDEIEDFLKKQRGVETPRGTGKGKGTGKRTGKEISPRKSTQASALTEAEQAAKDAQHAKIVQFLEKTFTDILGESGRIVDKAQEADLNKRRSNYSYEARSKLGVTNKAVKALKKVDKELLQEMTNNIKRREQQAAKKRKVQDRVQDSDPTPKRTKTTGDVLPATSTIQAPLQTPTSEAAAENMQEPASGDIVDIDPPTQFADVQEDPFDPFGENVIPNAQVPPATTSVNPTPVDFDLQRVKQEKDDDDDCQVIVEFSYEEKIEMLQKNSARCKDCKKKEDTPCPRHYIKMWELQVEERDYETARKQVKKDITECEECDKQLVGVCTTHYKVSAMIENKQKVRKAMEEDKRVLLNIKKERQDIQERQRAQDSAAKSGEHEIAPTPGEGKGPGTSVTTPASEQVSSTPYSALVHEAWRLSIDLSQQAQGQKEMVPSSDVDESDDELDVTGDDQEHALQGTNGKIIVRNSQLGPVIFEYSTDDDDDSVADNTPVWKAFFELDTSSSFDVDENVQLLAKLDRKDEEGGQSDVDLEPDALSTKAQGSSEESSSSSEESVHVPAQGDFSSACKTHVHVYGPEECVDHSDCNSAVETQTKQGNNSTGKPNTQVCTPDFTPQDREHEDPGTFVEDTQAEQISNQNKESQAQESVPETQESTGSDNIEALSTGKSARDISMVENMADDTEEKKDEKEGPSTIQKKGRPRKVTGRADNVSGPSMASEVVRLPTSRQIALAEKKSRDANDDGFALPKHYVESGKAGGLWCCCLCLHFKINTLTGSRSLRGVVCNSQLVNCEVHKNVFLKKKMKSTIFQSLLNSYYTSLFSGTGKRALRPRK